MGNQTATNEQVVKSIEEKQYVTFLIANEIYGVPILTVQEIIGLTKITSIPNTLPYMKGVINLRGLVVPVFDMRKKFSMPEMVESTLTVIIIVEVKEIQVGMIVDSVADVLSIPIKSIQQTPNFSANIDKSFIEGIGNNEEDLIIILDVNKIMTLEEYEIIEANAKSSV